MRFKVELTVLENSFNDKFIPDFFFKSFFSTIQVFKYFTCILAESLGQPVTAFTHILINLLVKSKSRFYYIIWSSFVPTPRQEE